MPFYIRATVSNGLTGHGGTRTTVLRRNGKAIEFETEVEAEAHAATLTEIMNHGQVKATFRYEATAFPDVKRTDQ